MSATMTNRGIRGGLDSRLRSPCCLAAVLLVGLALVLDPASAPGRQGEKRSVAADRQPTVYIPPCDTPPGCSDGFNLALAAAIVKKRVPVAMVTSQYAADWVLRWSVSREGLSLSVGVFAPPPGTTETNANVQLVDRTGRVVWACSVRRERFVGSSDVRAANAVAGKLKKFLKQSQGKQRAR